MWVFFRFLLLVFVVLQLNQLMSEITLGELTIFGEDSKLDALLGNYYHHFSFGNLYSAIGVELLLPCKFQQLFARFVGCCEIIIVFMKNHHFLK